MKISSFMGSHVSALLQSSPFNQWAAERSTPEDLEENEAPEIHYIFEGHGLSLTCDDKDNIIAIFLEADKHNALDGDLFVVPFDWTREQVISRFGKPTKSGPGGTHPALGTFGPWDRFSLSTYNVHFQYRIDRNSIKQITLMRNDVVP